MSCKAAGDDRRHLKREVFQDGYCFTCHHGRKRHRRRTGRLSAVLRTFGWSEVEIAALRLAQRWGRRVRCAGCGNPVDAGKEPAMDHNHALEKAGVAIRYTVRGLLCSTCNQYLGHIGDDPVKLIRLALYLIDPPAPKVLRSLDTS